MIARESIDEVLDRASLVELVSESVTLKRQGTRYLGLCPFHNERTPSFSVRDDHFFYCFGCGASGNAIGYVMRTKGVSFVEAVEEIAARVGVALKRTTGGPGKPKTDLAPLFEANRLAAEYFRNELHRSNEAIAYLKSRSVIREAVEAFGVGFAPPVRTGLLEFLKSRRVPEDVAVAAGLIRRSDQGQPYDVFRARLVFPVFVDEKRIAGFGGRILPVLMQPGVDLPKYLNTPESDLYQKSKIFFGLPQAFRAIRDEGEVYLVEGYLDVLGMWQAGVKNTVATCGTAFTAKHVGRLKHLARRVRFLYDADAAGQAGAAKAFPLFVNSGLDSSAVFLPEPHDPDTFAIEQGAETAGALRKLPSRSLFECYVHAQIEAQGATSASQLGPAGKGAIAKTVSALLLGIENPVERGELIERAASLIGTTPAALAETGGGPGREPTVVEAAPEEPAVGTTSAAALPALDQEVLRALMVLKGEGAEGILADPDFAQALSPVTLAFISGLHAIVLEGQNSESPGEDAQRTMVKALLEEFGESWTALWRQAYSLHGRGRPSLPALASDWKHGIAKRRLAEEISAVRLDLASAVTEESKLELAQRQIQLERRLREM